MRLPPRRSERETLAGQRAQGAGEDVGDDQVEGRGMPQPRVVEAERTGGGDAAGAVGVGVGACHLHRDGIGIGGDDLRAVHATRGRDGEHARSAAEVEHAAKSPRARQLVDGEKAAERCRVMRRAEGFAGIDDNGARTIGDAPAVVAAVHDEAAGDDRRQCRLRDRDPVEVGQVFQRHVGDWPALLGPQPSAAACASARLCA